jgi:FkbM family methyltransferase
MDIVNPRYEPALLETIEENLKTPRDPPPVFVDIGAHIGKYTVFAGRILEGRGHVVAIEPDPENFSLLRRNVDLNGLNNVDLVNVGCWSRDGVLSLHRGRGNLGEHSFIDDVGSESVSVPVRTLDSILSDLRLATVDLLKIDVQRAEGEVLKGATTSLSTSRAMTVIFEEVGDPDVAESVRILQAQGFRVRRLDASNFLAEH